MFAIEEFSFFPRDQSLRDLMPLYKTMKKATFSDSEDEVCLLVYVFTLQFGCDVINLLVHYVTWYFFIRMRRRRRRKMMKILIHLEHPHETLR